MTDPNIPGLNINSNLTLHVSEDEFNSMLMKVVVWSVILVVIGNIVRLFFSRVIGD